MSGSTLFWYLRMSRRETDRGRYRLALGSLSGGPGDFFPEGFFAEVFFAEGLFAEGLSPEAVLPAALVRRASMSRFTRAMDSSSLRFAVCITLPTVPGSQLGVPGAQKQMERGVWRGSTICQPVRVSGPIDGEKWEMVCQHALKLVTLPCRRFIRCRRDPTGISIHSPMKKRPEWWPASRKKRGKHGRPFPGQPSSEVGASRLCTFPFDPFPEHLCAGFPSSLPCSDLVPGTGVFSSAIQSASTCTRLYVGTCCIKKKCHLLLRASPRRFYCARRGPSGTHQSQVARGIGQNECVHRIADTLTHYAMKMLLTRVRLGDIPENPIFKGWTVVAPLDPSRRHASLKRFVKEYAYKNRVFFGRYFYSIFLRYLFHRQSFPIVTLKMLCPEAPKPHAWVGRGSDYYSISKSLAMTLDGLLSSCEGEVSKTRKEIVKETRGCLMTDAEQAL